MARPKIQVPSTISSEQMASLRWRARNHPTAKNMFAPRAVARRKASSLQKSKARWS